MRRDRDKRTTVGRPNRGRLWTFLRAARRRITGAVTLMAFVATSLGVCVVPVGEQDAVKPVAASAAAHCCSGQRAAAAMVHLNGRAGCCCSQDRRDAGTCCCAGTQPRSQRNANSSSRDRGQHVPTWSACHCGGPDGVWLVNAQPKLSQRPSTFALAETMAQVALSAPLHGPDCSLEPATPPPRPSCA